MDPSRGARSAAITAAAKEYSATITRIIILINALPSEFTSGRIASTSNAAPPAPSRINRIEGLTNLSFWRFVAARERSRAGATDVITPTNSKLENEAMRGAVQTKKCAPLTLGICIEIRVAGTRASICRDKAPRTGRPLDARALKRARRRAARQASRRTPRCHKLGYRGANKA